MAGGPDYPPGEPPQPRRPQPPRPRQPQPPQYGQPNPQYAQPQQGQPQYGQPQYGQPQYGQPQYGQPQYQPYGHAYAPQGPMPGSPGYLPPEAFGGFWIRFVGYIIDAMVLSIPSVVASAIVFAAFGFSPTVMFDINSRQTLAMEPQFQIANNLSSLVQLLIFWPYYAFMHSKYGATLGKLALGLRVVDDTRRYPSFARSTGRYFATILSACLCLIGYIWAGFHAQKRALHDLIGGTFVVKKHYAAQAQQPGL